MKCNKIKILYSGLTWLECNNKDGTGTHEKNMEALLSSEWQNFPFVSKEPIYFLSTVFMALQSLNSRRTEQYAWMAASWIPFL